MFALQARGLSSTSRTQVKCQVWWQGLVILAQGRWKQNSPSASQSSLIVGVQASERGRLHSPSENDKVVLWPPKACSHPCLCNLIRDHTRVGAGIKKEKSTAIIPESGGDSTERLSLSSIHSKDIGIGPDPVCFSAAVIHSMTKSSLGRRWLVSVYTSR